ncbi:hypothetical protein TNCV_2581791 [Trichonephila clavipes]|nr:hypothetical protein TNCV_2581791 [Trichonephila clavipes]
MEKSGKCKALGANVPHHYTTGDSWKEHFTCDLEVRVPHETSSIEDWTKDDALRSFNLINMGSSCMSPDWSGICQNMSEDQFVDKQFISLLKAEFLAITVQSR